MPILPTFITRSVMATLLPTGFLDTRNQSLTGHIPEANTANAEFTVDRAGSATQATTHPNLDPVARTEFLLGCSFFIRFQLRKVALEFNSFGRSRHKLFPNFSLVALTLRVMPLSSREA